MKKLLLLSVVILLPMVASAYDAEINGIYYNLNKEDKTAEVTKGENKQIGDLVIPETITLYDITYNVTSIGDEAFERCGNLNSITLPNTISRIGKFAFYQCLEMTSVNIPSSVIEIDEQAFRYCWKLTTIDLPNSVTKISDGVFMDCQKLENITIPTTITSVGIGAFRRCYKLTAIILPNGVTTIGASAFLDCSNLSTIYLPESITSVGYQAFTGTQWYENLSDGLIYIGKVVYKFKGTTADNTVIEIKDGTTEITDLAFYDCKGLVSIKIPESVSAIGESAFQGCSKLVSVNLPSSITEIAASTFYDCLDLSSIILPDGLIYIGQQAFRNTNLSSIAFPNKLTTIEYAAFAGCNNLESIQIPATVSSLNSHAFSNKNLKALTIATGNTTYDSRNNCNAIIETATNTLIFGCQSSFIPDGIEKIDNEAFVGCEYLSSIVIPSSVKSIGDFAFDTCPSLSSVTLNNGLEALGKQAFCRCSSLNTITLPSTLQEIGEHAFSSTNLTTITSLIEDPFKIDATVFLKLYTQATLYVPDGTKNKYQNTEAWKQFTNIVEVIKQCEKPVIYYEKGKLNFECATEGADFITSISNTDIKSYTGNTIDLSVTYTVNVVATATGYKNSETATATLCWIDAEPKKEGITGGIANVQAHAVMIQCSGGVLNIQGADDGTPVSVYNVSGIQEGAATISNGSAVISTNIPSGSIAIVKIGQKSVKVVMK